MIIGNGLIANAFKKKDKNSLIFASGVSSSKIKEDFEFNREKTLILKILNENPNTKFIYFSSILVEHVNNDYYKHNLKMEELIKNNSKNFLIFRLPQIIGNGGNPDNLINTFVTKIKSNEKTIIFNRNKRAIIDVDDIVKLVNYCKNKLKNQIIEISHIEQIEVGDLYLMLTKILNCNPNMELDVNIKHGYETKNSEIINEAILKLKIVPYRYTIGVLKKYLQ